MGLYQVISAFKVHGKQVEPGRTTHEKTHADFVRCTNIPEDTEICFIDDTMYPKMTHDNVYYIHLKPYVYDLPFTYMTQKFENTDIGRKILARTRSSFAQFMIMETKKYNFVYKRKTPEEYEIDKFLGKHTLAHLQFFFNEAPKPRTKKKQPKIKTNKSRRHH